MTAPRTRISATVYETPDPRALATFYESLLGWERVEDHPGWVRIKPAGQPNAHGMSFSIAKDHVRPVWPATPGEQQMQTHLDISVEDLEAGVAHALGLGGRLADFQPQPRVRVVLDPDGHPFCLFEGGV